jgi:LSD1 subclass zinc finger protein
MGLFKRRSAAPGDGGPAPAATGPPPPASLTAHSAFVKRATCERCGAPKTLPSKTAYLYCDYCGALVDYDFRLANAGMNAGLTNTIYHQLAAPHQPALAQAKAGGDRDTYRSIMRWIFSQWIEQCPMAVSPRARTDPEFRQRMVDYCAESAVCKDLDPTQQQLDAQMQAVLAGIQRVPTAGGTWMAVGDIWHAAALWKQQMDLAYAAMEATGVTALDPDEPPPGIAVKLEYSTFCQAWLPHLPPADGERLLAFFGLTGDYVQVQPQVTEQHTCGACGASLTILPGARVVVCEECGRRLDIGAGALACRRCGAMLDLPVGSEPITCPYCRTENHRV